MERQTNFPPAAPDEIGPWFLPEYPDRPVYGLVPSGYRPDRPLGLLLFLHGGDRDSPPEQPHLLHLKRKTGLLRPPIDHHPLLTVAPAAPPAADGKRWNRAGVGRYLLSVIEDACRRFAIDRDRIILGGHSMGGFGAFHQAPLLADRLAGVWMSSGAWLEEDFRGCLGTGIYLMHGRWDCASSYRESHVEPRHHDWCGVSFARAAHELMLRDDVPHVYDEHQGGHSLRWEPAQLALRRFLVWAARQRRNRYPARCAVISPNGSCDPDLEACRKSFWLEITATVPGTIALDRIVLTGPNIAWHAEELEMQSYYLAEAPHPGARLIGENLGNNKFMLQAENVRSLRLHLHPAMADLTREVELRVNGAIVRAMPEAGGDGAYPAAVAVDLG